MTRTVRGASSVPHAPQAPDGTTNQHQEAPRRTSIKTSAQASPSAIPQPPEAAEVASLAEERIPATRPRALDAIAPATLYAFEQQLPVVAWLDPSTANALRRLVGLVALGAPGVRAILLFGSVARHEERPLTDPAPSDVDLLVLFDPPAPTHRQPTGQTTAEGAPQNTPQAEPESLTAQQQTVLSQAVVQALQAFPDAARDVHVTGAIPPFTRWDASFFAHVAQDGLLVWAAASPPELPAPLDRLRTMQDDQVLGASGAGAARIGERS